MKAGVASQVYGFLGNQYRYSFHSLLDEGSGLLEIEIFVPPRNSWCKERWQRIYFGHVDPIEEAVRYYNKRVGYKNEKNDPLYLRYRDDGGTEGG